MEALTAVSVAALTVYDMCKAIDKSITISEVRLESKTGARIRATIFVRTANRSELAAPGKGCRKAATDYRRIEFNL